MPTNKHHCCDDAQAIIYKHKCSNNRSHVVNGSFISPLLDECKKYQICRSLWCYIDNNRKNNNSTELLKKRNEIQLEEENSAKKQCRMQDNIFINELKQYERYKPMKEISSCSKLR